MACAGLFLVSVVAAMTASLPDVVRPGSTPTIPPPSVSSRASSGPIDLSVPGAIHRPAISSSGAGLELPASDSNRWEAGDTRTSINLGPFHTEFGGVTGRHMHVATVKLEGVSLFGGSIGGSIDSRSARITFSWPTSR